MDSRHHCNDCPYWYVTQKKYLSGFYNITICRKYNKQLYYLAGEENRTPHPCDICSKRFTYVPYIPIKIKGGVKIANGIFQEMPEMRAVYDSTLKIYVWTSVYYIFLLLRIYRRYMWM